MPHVVTSKCQGCKFTDCVEVCPVTCFYELADQVVIHPDECIDCRACVETCPVQAIYADTEIPAKYESAIEFNANEARRLKQAGKEGMVQKKEPLPTAAQKKAELGY
jgi:ferredoxin